MDKKLKYRFTREKIQYYGLSAQEMEVAKYIAMGFEYKEIADKMFMAVSTVKTHANNAIRKLHFIGVHSKVKLAVWVYVMGFLPVSEAADRIFSKEWRAEMNHVRSLFQYELLRSERKARK